MSDLKFLKATLNEKKPDRVTGMQMPLQKMEVLLPFNAIGALKAINGNEYEVLVRKAFLPDVHFTVGSITATLKKDQLQIL